MKKVFFIQEKEFYRMRIIFMKKKKAVENFTDNRITSGGNKE